MHAGPLTSVACRQEGIKQLKTFYDEFGGAVHIPFCVRLADVTYRLLLREGMFNRQADFNAALAAATDNYGALVIDRMNPSPRLEDRVFWYRGAKTQPPFECGAPWFRRQCSRLLDKKWQEREDEPHMTAEEQRAAAKRKKEEEKEMTLAKKRKLNEPARIVLLDQ